MQPNLSTCLSGKREATRQVSDNIEYRCIKTKAELEKNIDGSFSIKKFDCRIMRKVNKKKSYS